MAKRGTLASLSIDALLKLRDDVGNALSERAGALRRQLSALTGSDVPALEVGSAGGAAHRLRGVKFRRNTAARKTRN